MAGPLIGSDDPPAFTHLNPGGRARALLLADHASAAMPRSLNRLGLGDVPLERHIAYDIGSRVVTEKLSELLDAPALVHGYSRLLIDPNRELDDPTSICVISDGVVVPGNRGLDAADVAARAMAFFHPYHDAIETEIDRLTARDGPPAIISVHTFTPLLRGAERPWHVGILWDDDGRMPVPLIEALRRDPALLVGDNEPYSGRNRHGNTVESHAYPRDLPNVLIEIRQDLVASDDDAKRWADRLAEPLAAILADTTIFEEVAA
jgi:predicted N-formylglutamate amidohydrolase